MCKECERQGEETRLLKGDVSCSSQAAAYYNSYLYSPYGSTTQNQGIHRHLLFTVFCRC